MIKRSLFTAIGAALITGQASAQPADNPFEITQLPGGYMVAAEGKCGGKMEGKCGGAKIEELKAMCEEKMKAGFCGEGKCGEGKCGESLKAKCESMKEGKCGGKT